MAAILVALVLLAAGVAVIYLILKNMCDDGIDIAAPGSCRRGQCGVRSQPAKEDGEAPATPDADDQQKPRL